MKYGVHIYAVCRRRIEVEADSQEEAVLKANASDMNELFDCKIGSKCEVEFADEVQDFLVDEEGDGEYSRTKCWEIGPDDKPVLKFDH